MSSSAPVPRADAFYCFSSLSEVLLFLSKHVLASGFLLTTSVGPRTRPGAGPCSSAQWPVLLRGVCNLAPLRPFARMSSSLGLPDLPTTHTGHLHEFHVNNNLLLA